MFGGTRGMTAIVPENGVGCFGLVPGNNYHSYYSPSYIYIYSWADYALLNIIRSLTDPAEKKF